MCIDVFCVECSGVEEIISISETAIWTALNKLGEAVSRRVYITCRKIKVIMLSIKQVLVRVSKV